MRHSAHKIKEPILTLGGEEKELEVLELLLRYDLLPSSFIYHATGNHDYTTKVLKNLAKGLYIGLPDLTYQEKLAYIPKNSFYIYELKPPGKALLAMKGRYREPHRGNDHFQHKLLRSKIEYCLDHSGLKPIFPEDILARNPKTAAEDYPWQLVDGLTPDITRGFEHNGHAAFLHVEVDRGTETLISRNHRQTLERKLARYKAYLDRKIHFSRYGIFAPTILFLTTLKQRKDNIKHEAMKYAHPRFAFMCVEDLKPDTQLLGEWDGLEQPIHLTELLNGYAKGPRASGQARKAS